MNTWVSQTIRVKDSKSNDNSSMSRAQFKYALECIPRPLTAPLTKISNYKEISIAFDIKLSTHLDYYLCDVWKNFNATE